MVRCKCWLVRLADAAGVVQGVATVPLAQAGAWERTGHTICLDFYRPQGPLLSIFASHASTIRSCGEIDSLPAVFVGNTSPRISGTLLCCVSCRPSKWQTNEDASVDLVENPDDRKIHDRVQSVSGARGGFITAILMILQRLNS